MHRRKHKGLVVPSRHNTVNRLHSVLKKTGANTVVGGRLLFAIAIIIHFGFPKKYLKVFFLLKLILHKYVSVFLYLFNLIY